MTAVGAPTRLTRVVDTDAHEGPVYVACEDALYFTTPSGAINRLALEPMRISVVRPDANAANGMALGQDGRLVVCEQGSRSQEAAITSVDPATGARDVLVDCFDGLRLNSPNDVVVKSDGTLWFTDPSYGYLQGFRPQPQVGDHVYRYDPRSGELSVVADSFDKPNGLAFSPGETTLYVGDSGANHEPGSFDPDRPHHVKAFEVVDGRRLAGERVLCEISPGFPDGIKVDEQGRVYASSFSGVQVFDPAGERLAEIELPGAVNFTFGGPDRNVLFITADDAIWAAHLQANDTGGSPRWR